MAAWLRSLPGRSRHRAIRSQLSHDRTPDLGLELFKRQRGRCAVSGLPFSLRRFDGVLVKHPFAPSFHRISSHQGGYTTDDVRLVCIAVNFGMGQWGEDLYLTFARAAVAERDTGALPGRPPDRWR
jgi:hypothetical protein